MKKILLKTILVLASFALYLVPAFGQTPESLSYQAVIRNSSDALITNTQLGMQISILQGSATGTVVYVETQTPTSNANGLVSIEIGGGNVESGDFSAIDWANGTYFIKTETDPEGGTSYTITGVSQLLSVPYALHAKTAETVDNIDALLARIEELENYNVLNDGFTDERDGTHYNAVKIGNQIWMAENLKYLPSVVGSGTGSNTDPYYYVYGYDGTDVDEAKQEANYQIYGVLYNWTAAMAGASSSDANPSGVQGVCPDGWHLPSDAEWKELEMALGMSQTDADDTGHRGTNEGSKLAGNADLWNNGNLKTDSEFDSSGFLAFPGGYRYSNGSFVGIGNNAFFWGATENDSSKGWYRRLYYGYSSISRDIIDKELGCSVRCVKD